MWLRIRDVVVLVKDAVSAAADHLGAAVAPNSSMSSGKQIGQPPLVRGAV